MEDFEIKSVGDFLKVIDSLNRTHVTYFFRGQSDFDWKIESSIYRKNKELNSSYLRASGEKKEPPKYLTLEFTRRIHQNFTDSYPSFPEVHLLRNYFLNDIDLMMVSQHYGLPTRLIDWSLSPLVALYFAVEEFPEKDSCVFSFCDYSRHSEFLSFSGSQVLLNSLEKERRFAHLCSKILDENLGGINSFESFMKISKSDRKTIFHPFLSVFPNFSSSAIEPFLDQLLSSLGGRSPKNVLDYFRKHVPSDLIPNAMQDNCALRIYSRGHFFIRPLPLNQRIKNQQGVFQFSQSPFDEDPINSEIVGFSNDFTPKDMGLNLIKIKVQAEYKVKILGELARYGISRDFIYPEIDSYAKEMTKRVYGELLRELS